MKKPRLVIITDDEKSMQSQLSVTINKDLDRIIVKHTKQYGTKDEIFQIFHGQIDVLAKFLTQAKIWIESGYNDKLKPESFKEHNPINNE